LEDEVEESDDREGFSVGGVNNRVGSTRDGHVIVGGVITRLPARDRAGLENGVEFAVLDAREELVVGSVEALGRCADRKVDEGSEVVELVDGRRIRKEESRVDTLLGGLAVLQEEVGSGEESGEGDRCGKCALDVERRPSVDGSRIVSGSAFDSTYWVIARGAGEIRRLRDQFERRRWGSSRSLLI
jgi:hypothetical protein